MGIESYSTNPNLNTNQLGISTATGDMAISNTDDAVRMIMAHLAIWYQAAQPLIGTITSKQAASAALGALTGAGAATDRIAYYTGPDSAALAAITLLGRTILSKATGPEVCNAIGAARQSAYSLTNPGYLKLDLGSGTIFMLAWGTFTAVANTATVVSYATSFPSISFPIVSGGSTNPSETQNPPGVVSSGSANFTVRSAHDFDTSSYYIAVGY
jgi:hypothetical protein